MHRRISLKKLKFTLKQLRHVSVQTHHLQGGHYSCSLKLQLLHSHVTTKLTTDVFKLTILTTVTLGSTNNALPEDGVFAPKHVGAVLM